MSDGGWQELFAALSAWEATAVLLGIAYLLLATREHIACWICALLSTAIYTVLFWEHSLLMESALNVYYMAMALYGWWRWHNGGANGATLTITSWRPVRHFWVIGIVLMLSSLSGMFLSKYTDASWPFVDSFTTWGAVVTTWMVAWKVLENWIYWFVIDAISIPIYVDRGLYLTAILFGIYLVIVVIGYLSWHRDFKANHDEYARS
jgi:nicotinamide mononucleotide transporter